MAIIKTIEWDDGSGDNIYLTYPSASGDQTVTVSSDANTGSENRTMGITFTATHNGTSVVRVLTVTQDGAPEEYIIFVDPTVEQICVTNWGDGIGLKPSQASVVTNSQFGTKFRGNTSITSFDELSYFTGLTTITAGSSTSSTGAFGGCTALESVTIPSGIRTVGAYSFYNSGIKDLELPSFVTSVGAYAFANCTKLNRLVIPSSVSTVSNSIFSSAGDSSSTSTIIIGGTVDTAVGSIYCNFNKLVINGDVTLSVRNAHLVRYGTLQILKVGGDVRKTTTRSVYGLLLGCSSLQFVELMGTLIDCAISYNPVGATGVILHLGYEGVAATASQIFSNSRWAKVYVGDGSSSAHDDAILSQYLADSGWSSHSSVLDTWYNYINSPTANSDYID